MKRALAVFIIMVLLITGCDKNTSASEPAENGITTVQTVTADTTESTAVITSTAEITTTAKKQSSVTTTVTESPKPEPLLLKAKENGNTHYVEKFTVVNPAEIWDEEDFPDKEHLQLAKQNLYEKDKMNINRYNESIIEADDEMKGKKLINSADDIEFIYGVQYDFNNDGLTENIIMLSSTSFMSSSFIAYINGDDIYWLVGECNYWDERYQDEQYQDGVKIIECNDFTGCSINFTAGAIYYAGVLFSFENGEPEVLISGLNYYKDNKFYITEKYSASDKIALWDSETKTFRQLADIELTKEEFIDYFENGKEGIEYIENLTGWSDYKIHTQGYVNYYFSCENEHLAFFGLDENGEAELDEKMLHWLVVWYSGEYKANEYILTEDKNLIYGVDANNLAVNE